MTLTVTVVVGNPKPASRTRQVAVALAERLFPEAPPAVMDLADHAAELFDWSSERMVRITEAVAASDVVLFASPTYKASYTGMLKAFLDRYPSDGLRGVTAIPVHTGADLGHSLAPTVSLAPLLAELGAVVPGRGFYFVTADMAALDEAVAAAAERYAANISRVARLAGGVRG